MIENNAVNLVKTKILDMKKKANHNKLEALWGVRIIILFGMSAPIFIAFGSGLVYGKIIPSVLSLIAAILTAWLQIRKPQNLWYIYRTAQRKFEVEIELYQFDIGFYNVKTEEKDKILIRQVTDIYLDTHNKWSEIVPSMKNIEKLDGAMGGNYE
ncbi:DUF4231 domain-containing protein [Wohlfahrtiimonas populi]|uniref:DUF4231 domain-containing protein n=1 Tax=Wohlfahrtiimonas populi TaxID=1940240 RepID=UPI00098CFFE4|nr:DUF4231 domain-containing protein [Wohlfahrtiimonas populi]